MSRQRTVILSAVAGILVILVSLCLFTYYRVTIPVAILKKEAARYDDYRKNFENTALSINNDELKELRTMVNDCHVDAAMKFGVSDLIDEKDVKIALKEKKLVLLKETRFWRIKELKDSLPYVTPDTLKLLTLIGEKFHENLRKQNLPLYRFTISSVLRTERAQQLLTRKNRNATRNISSHQFGTTVDILFTEFEYTGENPLTFQCLRKYSDKPEFKKAYFDALGNQYAPKLKIVLGKTLLELQRQGYCYVIYERRQPVFHTTIARKF